MHIIGLVDSRVQPLPLFILTRPNIVAATTAMFGHTDRRLMRCIQFQARSVVNGFYLHLSMVSPDNAVLLAKIIRSLLERGHLFRVRYIYIPLFEHFPAWKWR